jgi:hypothetical protein
MMHICFHIRDDVDFNEFIADLEEESARRGMTQVRANRVVTVKTEQERRSTPIDANSNAITSGLSNGWRLIYCKGPEGEQLEFVQALGPVKRTFDKRARGAAAGGRSMIRFERTGALLAAVALRRLWGTRQSTQRSPPPLRQDSGRRLRGSRRHPCQAGQGRRPTQSHAATRERRAERAEQSALLPARGSQRSGAFRVLRDLREQGRLRRPQRDLARAALVRATARAGRRNVSVLHLEILGNQSSSKQP